MKPLSFIIFITSLTLFTVGNGCAGKAPSSSPPPLPDRDPTLAYRLFQEGALLIDVRSPAEYEASHLEGSRLIPISELQSHLDEVVKLQGGDKNKPIVVHCQAGVRAGQAKEILMNAGFTQVTNLGNMNDWPGKKK